MPIIEKAPNRYKQGTEVAHLSSQSHFTATCLPSYTHMRLYTKLPTNKKRRPRKAPRGKTACYYPYPLAILIGYTQSLTELALLGNLDLLLHEVIERLLIKLAKRLRACV